MALTHHDDIELMIGDAWLIVGKLLDEDGQPVDLMAGNITLGWTLCGPDGNQLPGLADTVTVTPEAGGIVSIAVPDSITRTLQPARYLDSIRVWTGSEPATHWVGVILADADPFHAVAGGGE